MFSPPKVKMVGLQWKKDPTFSDSGKIEYFKNNITVTEIKQAREIRAGVWDIISLYNILLDSGGARTMLGPIMQYT